MSNTTHSTTFILPLLPSRVDLHNLSAIFDGDDVLWPIFGPAAKSVGIDPAKLDNFIIQNSPHYSKEEQEKLFEAFRDTKLFEQAKFYPGIEKMAILHELGVHVKIDSKSSTEAIAEVKRRRFKATMPFLCDSDLNLTVSGKATASSRKQIGREVTFFSDDSPYNILGSHAVYNLLPHKTWNSNAAECYRMRHKNFYFFSGLNSILATMIESVRFWQKHYL